MARPLTLKQEKARTPEPESAQKLPIAVVMVDNGVFHLDYLHDYKVPAELSSEVDIGSRVQVSFNGIRREGVVYLRREKPDRAGRLLSIEKVLGPLIADAASVALVSAASQRWASHPYDVWRTLLPPRVIGVEKREISLPKTTLVDGIKINSVSRSYHFLPPFVDEISELAGMASTLLKDGNVLLILPDEKNIEDFIAYSGMQNCINLSSTLSKSERYFNFLTMSKAENVLYIGSRASIFAPVKKLSGIIVHREISENYYEPRSPGWNVRDVALIRNDLEKVKLIFTGFGPSSELARLINSRYVTFVDVKRKVPVLASPSTFGELLPSKILSSMKRALTVGSILVLVPKKGYASGVVCTSCRNVAHHSCGGVVVRRSLKGPYQCSLCEVDIPLMSCHWCKKESFSIVGKGSARIVEEIGRAIPGKSLIESNAEKLLLRTEGIGKIIVATSGAQPHHRGGFSGVYILEAERFLSGINLRSIERAEEAFFATFSRAASQSEIAITVDGGHPIVASLSRWNPKILLLRSLREREEAHLPPFVRSISFEIPPKEVAQFQSGIRKAIQDGRLPHKTVVREVQEKVRVEAPHSEASSVISFFHEYARKRSIAGKKLYSFRIDPYEFS